MTKTQQIMVPELKPAELGKIESMELRASAMVVHAPEERTAAMEAIRYCVATIKGIKEYFADSKGQAHTLWQTIRGQERELLARVESARRALDRAVQLYDGEQRQKAEEERARLQAEEDARARREQERLAKAAAKLKTPELREERLEEAAAIEPVAVIVAPVIEKVAGERKVTTWKARVVDANAVPRAWLTPNLQTLGAFAKATKGAMPVPGVEFYCESRTSIVG